jgi:hypothetical protein
MVYAMYDWTAKCENPGHGFANTKNAVAFSTRKKLDEFLTARGDWDLSARRISRSDAMKMLVRVYGQADKGLPLNGLGPDAEMVVLRPSKY